MKYEVMKFEPYNVRHVGELLLHIRCIHTRERPFQCSYCPKNFQRRDLLRKHERIHTDTRPYGCEFCGKTFTARDKMIVHRRLHTGELSIYVDSNLRTKGFYFSTNKRINKETGKNKWMNCSQKKYV